MEQVLAPEALRKVPPEMATAVSLRATWSHCALERSRFGPVHLEGPGFAFHHLALVLSGEAARAGMEIDGRRDRAWFGPGALSVIAEGHDGAAWWDRPVESACFYFTQHALSAVLGRDVAQHQHDLRTEMIRNSPVVCRLLRHLHDDAMAGQPQGRLRGDTLFLALAAQLVLPAMFSHGPLLVTMADRRVRHALAYIHAHLSAPLSIDAIAAAAASSPFHLARCFRSAVGCSIWQYVLRERARLAAEMIRRDRMGLSQVARRSGFETYASFVSAVRREFGVAPAQLRETAVRR